MQKKQYPIGFEVAAEWGCFADHTTGSETVSLPLPPVPAIVGMVQSICRIVGVWIEPAAVGTCTYPELSPYYYNSFSCLRPKPNIVDNVPCQVHEYYLVKPRFQVLAYLSNLDKSHPRFQGINNAHSCCDQFFRRLRRGQSFHAVCMGRKEMLCTYVGPIVTPLCESFETVIPSMLGHIWDSNAELNISTVTNVEVRRGVIEWIPGATEIRDGKLAFTDPWARDYTETSWVRPIRTNRRSKNNA